MEKICLHNLSYTSGKEKIVRELSYEFIPHAITGILAPVEEQMSFLLKMMGGIVEPTGGTITIDGKDFFKVDDQVLREIRKNIAYCFNRGGLLSNLNIYENLLLPLEYHYPELTAAQRHKRILTICKQMDIHQSILDERPALLHPQMYKMALLARAFVLEPKIILYDNPLLDLEMKYKKIVYNHILHLREHLSVTQIFISTSDILFEITDTNLVFNRGAIVESGTWDELILSEQTATQNIIREYLETGLNPG